VIAPWAQRELLFPCRLLRRTLIDGRGEQHRLYGTFPCSFFYAGCKRVKQSVLYASCRVAGRSCRARNTRPPPPYRNGRGARLRGRLGRSHGVTLLGRAQGQRRHPLYPDSGKVPRASDVDDSATFGRGALSDLRTERVLRTSRANSTRLLREVPLGELHGGKYHQDDVDHETARGPTDEVALPGGQVLGPLADPHPGRPKLLVLAFDIRHLEVERQGGGRAPEALGDRPVAVRDNRQVVGGVLAVPEAEYQQLSKVGSKPLCSV
jgi:hypothetical protein